MQQQHSLSGSNPEKIASLASLVEAIKQNQVATPSAKFRLTVGEMKFRVNLLPFGYIEVDGRIPVEAFVGGEAAWAAARLRQATLVAEGVDAFLTSHEASLDAAGLPLPLAVRGVRDRCRALLLDRRVAAIVLVVQSDECASGGLPVDRVTAVRVVDRLIMRHEQPAEPAAAQAIEAVIDRLQELLRPAGTDRA